MRLCLSLIRWPSDKRRLLFGCVQSAMFRRPEFIPNLTSKETSQKKEKAEETRELSYDLLREKIFRVLKRSDSEQSEDERSIPAFVPIATTTSILIPSPLEADEVKNDDDDGNHEKSSKKSSKKSKSKNSDRKSGKSREPSRKSRKERDRSSAGSVKKQPMIYLEPPSPPEVITMVSQVTASDSEAEGVSHHLRVPNIRHHPATKKRTTGPKKTGKKSVPVTTEKKVTKEGERKSSKTTDKKVLKDAETNISKATEKISSKEKKNHDNDESDNLKKVTKEQDKNDPKPEPTITKKPTLSKEQRSKRRKSVLLPKRKMSITIDKQEEVSREENSDFAVNKSPITEAVTKTDYSAVATFKESDVTNLVEDVKEPSETTIGSPENCGLEKTNLTSCEKAVPRILENSKLPVAAQECWKIYHRLLQEGFKVPLTTLQRGLLTPTEMRIMVGMQLDNT